MTIEQIKEPHTVTHEEIEFYIARAREMRSEAIRTHSLRAFAALGSLFHRQPKLVDAK